jgi:D-alanyl-lipoteichoic acid acyltransferase DltB (MBOAT superfamily)
LRLLFILALAALFTFGLSYLHEKKLTTTEFQLVDFKQTDEGYVGLRNESVKLPVRIGEADLKALRVNFFGAGEFLNLEVEIHADDKDFEVVTPDNLSLPLQSCHSLSPNMSSCKARIHFDATSQYLIILSHSAVTIQDIDVKVLNAKRAVQSGKISVTVALCLFALIAPLFWFVSARSSQFLICIFSIVWLAAMSVFLCVGVLAFLTVFYVMLKVAAEKNAPFRRLSVLLISAIGLLIFVKSVLPHFDFYFSWSGQWLMLPLGLSYFIIRIIDLAFKTYTGQIQNLRPLEYFAYMLFPPTLAAGPITTLEQFRSSANFYATLETRVGGILRILIGLAKKIMADTISVYVVARGLEAGFYGHDNRSVPVVLIASAVAVYLDFSAYSDLAIGSARWAGWKLPENFNYPFLSRSMREFWKSWHMSLTQWITRHVFINASLETRRSPKSMQIVLPTFATMLTIGIWHGTETVWLLWAIHHTIGIFLGDGILHLRKSLGFASASPSAKTNSSGITKLFGMLFVWYWFSLGQAFTLTLDVSEAMENYLSLLSFGLL